ncbi:hypothetical protein PTNB85_03631 [Pyrenophora teres f. teres]|uniref:Uncharacterized protein n=1 Tax=Pyrenophora teres f. teres TaxID=97479 RepID=A0A6S6W1Y9_9PLEO|nr:hypothetical protein PTNB85_03631 [Pyrenophora teres f. teres]CAE7174027.1 hypothetical protein PTTW11_05548 [Pyrenophora teres f. teres]
MLFRRNKPLQVALVPPPANNPAHPLPSIPDTHSQPARTLEEILGLAPIAPKPPIHKATGLTCSNTSFSPTRAGHTPAKIVTRELSSKKTGHATIRTNATATQAEFESDAFAVHMPTTRLPVIDQPTSPVKRSHTAQIEAYRTYEEKARQIRERNNGQGVLTSYKAASYNYSGKEKVEKVTPPVQANEPPASSPRPAGSFPISPPLPQSSWNRSSKRHGIYIESARMTDGSNMPQTPSKSIVAHSNISPNTTRYRSRADSEAGASSSMSSPTRRPIPVKVRVMPKLAVPQEERIQTESVPSLYSRPNAAMPSRQTSRSPSPVKSMPNFTRQNSVDGDSIFGYTRKQDFTSTIGGPRAPTIAQLKTIEKPVKLSAKPTLTSRFPWLRTPGPRVTKPSTSPVVFRSTTIPKSARAESTYIDPFEKLDIITSSVPITPLSNSPAVPTHPISPARNLRPQPTKAQETHLSIGFMQLRQCSILVLKIALYVYVVIAAWFILDAVREAVLTIGVPFRVLLYVGGWICTVITCISNAVVRVWDRWEFKVV